MFFFYRDTSSGKNWMIQRNDKHLKTPHVYLDPEKEGVAHFIQLKANLLPFSL